MHVEGIPGDIDHEIMHYGVWIYGLRERDVKREFV